VKHHEWVLPKFYDDRSCASHPYGRSQAPHGSEPYRAGQPLGRTCRINRRDRNAHRPQEHLRPARPSNPPRSTAVNGIPW